MDLNDYLSSDLMYPQLSLADLLAARDLYHVHLMRHPNVVATAVGRYRIRNEDSWPSEKGAGKIHGTHTRTLENSGVRPYSWPAILVFVSDWVDAQQFSGKNGDYPPDQLLPKTLYLPDGRRVPVCVIEAPRIEHNQAAPVAPRMPLNNLGGGSPVLVKLQGQTHFATIACLVSDGHKAFALTNRHVTGEAGELLYSMLDGRERPIGLTAEKQLTRIPFKHLYPAWNGQEEVYVNLDVGLIDIDDLSRWTASVRNAGVIGPMVNLSGANLSLSLIGAQVNGTGAASGEMNGEIHALFYRYKSQGGFEYVADLFIGPRSGPSSNAGASNNATRFATHPGDSGTLWLLTPGQHEHGNTKDHERAPKLPLAMQWGENTLYAGQAAGAQSYALATLLSRVCALLEVDLIRGWNLDQPNTWGAIGHFSIAGRALNALSDNCPKLQELMTTNLALITPDDETILNSEFKGMGAAAFVPLADIPDFYWKHGTQGAARHFEGPNHFADMDQPRPGDQATLLSLCNDSSDNIDPAIWNAFYDSVTDLLSGAPISPEHRGLLPFRVWQIFDEMVTYAADAKQHDKFLCAAGVLAHYLGDACQPLHISYLHDGDPLQASTRTVNHVRGKKAGSAEEVTSALGQGVHSAYEDEMVSSMRGAILNALAKTPKVKAAQRVTNGFEAAVAVVGLMSRTFATIPPRALVDAFVQHPGSAGRAQFMQDRFGKDTIKVMKDGTHLIAVLWESAWLAGQGEQKAKLAKPITQQRAMEICADRDFLTSYSIAQITDVLKRP